MSRPGLEKLPIKKWKNKHENFEHTLVEGASFKLYNPQGHLFPNRKERYRASTKNMQWLIGHAVQNNLKLRAMGSGWSFTKVGVTEGGIVDTASLNFSFPMSGEYVHDQYLQSPEDLYFLQCGTIIYEINNRLAAKSPPRSIKASGASNGQTIAGALSTGTHGAAFKVGAIQDFVVGLHLVTGENTHIWLERATSPVVSEKFGHWLDADIIRDDALFYAALVSFGSFGFIHGVMIETEPLFLLEEHRLDKIPYDAALKKAMTQQDFSGLNIPGAAPEKTPYHFEVLVNNHRFEPENADKGAFIKFMYKKPYKLPYEVVERTNDFTYGDDLLGIISTVLDSLGSASKLLIPKLVNTMFGLAFKAQPPQTGTVRELFHYTKFRGKVGSAAIGVDATDSPRVLEAILQVNEQHPFPGGLSMRYVKGTKALLGFTRFPVTCVLEMDGVDSDPARKFYREAWLKLEAENIPYTLHWGKINDILDPQRVKNMYGEPAVNKWIEARNTLLKPEAIDVFNSAFLAKCGLDKKLGAIV
ncbi:FAD-binding protein [Croceiramulus getboli]|nr:FAD-binding protein [Flavobacteriaceae bacterium YJPT1-3]